MHFLNWIRRWGPQLAWIAFCGFLPVFLITATGGHADANVAAAGLVLGLCTSWWTIRRRDR